MGTTGIDPVYTSWYVADAEGLFKKNGLDATITLFDRGGEGLNAVIAGQQDTAGNAETPVILVLEKGADILVPAMFTRAPTTIKMVAKSSIKTPQDFKGKTIGAPLGSVSEYVWDRYFDKHGVNKSEVKYVNVAAPEVVAALDRGDIDAFFLWEPFPTRALETSGNKVHLMATSADDGVYESSLFMQVSGSFAEQNPKAVENILKSLIEANEIIKKDPDKAGQITAKVTKMEVAQATKLVKEFKYDVLIDDDTVNKFQEAAAWMQGKGQIKQIPDWKKSITPEFLKRVEPKNVNFTKW